MMKLLENMNYEKKQKKNLVLFNLEKRKLRGDLTLPVHELGLRVTIFVYIMLRGK